MSSLAVYRRSLRLMRRGLVGWGVGLGALVLLTAATWPVVKAQGEDLQQALDRLPEAMKAFFGDLSDITTGAGFLRGRLFGLLLPILLVVHAVMRGSDAIAGEEERGGLDLLLVQQPSRVQVLLGKAGALATAAVAFCVLLAMLLAPLVLAIGLGVPMERLALTLLMLFAHTLAIGFLALGVGAATGRKGLAVAAGIGAAVGGFLLEGLSNLAKDLEPLRYASSLYYYGGGKTLTALEPWTGLAVLSAVAAISLLAGALLLRRRDIGVA